MIVLLTRAIGRTVAIATKIPVGIAVEHRSPTRECVVAIANIPTLATIRTTTATIINVNYRNVPKADTPTLATTRMATVTNVKCGSIPIAGRIVVIAT